MAHSPPPASDAEDAAAGWWLARGSPDWTANDEARLAAWLAETPRHREAFAAVEAAMTFIDDSAELPELAAARLRARRALPPVRRAGPSMVRRAILGGGLAAGLAAAITLAVTPQTATYATGKGERRSLVLADGSRLSLDSDSRVTARLSGHARDLRLLAGQARFDVAKDRSRPFSVAVGDHVVIATGTAFNIDRWQERTTVTLLEGHVEIRGRRSGAAVARLAPGQQFLAQGAEPGRVIPAAPAQAALAWQSGKLVFDDEPLSSAVLRVNRYAAGPPVRLAPQLATLRISGLFTAGDTEAFVEAVSNYLPVSAVRGADGAVDLRPRAAKSP